MTLVVLRCEAHDLRLVSTDPSVVFGWLADHHRCGPRCLSFVEERLAAPAPAVEQLVLGGVSW